MVVNPLWKSFRKGFTGQKIFIAKKAKGISFVRSFNNANQRIYPLFAFHLMRFLVFQKIQNRIRVALDVHTPLFDHAKTYLQTTKDTSIRLLAIDGVTHTG